MRVLASCSLLFLYFLVTGCVSMSKYNDRVADINSLNGELSSLEKVLQKSDAARSALDVELAKAKENLATLQQEHEALKAQRFAESSPGGEVGTSAMDDRKQQFSGDMAALTARLSEAGARIKELTDALAATEEAAKKVPLLETALAEREQRILDLTKLSAHNGNADGTDKTRMRRSFPGKGTGAKRKNRRSPPCSPA